MEDKLERVVREVKEEGVIIPSSFMLHRFLKERELPVSVLGEMAERCKLGYWEEMCWVEVIALSGVTHFD